MDTHHLELLLLQGGLSLGCQKGGLVNRLGTLTHSAFASKWYVLRSTVERHTIQSMSVMERAVAAFRPAGHDSQSISGKMLALADTHPPDAAAGVSLVFLSARAEQALEEATMKEVGARIAVLQARWRTLQQQKQYDKDVAHIVRAQAYVRRFLAVLRARKQRRLKMIEERHKLADSLYEKAVTVRHTHLLSRCIEAWSFEHGKYRLADTHYRRVLGVRAKGHLAAWSDYTTRTRAAGKGARLCFRPLVRQVMRGLKEAYEVRRAARERYHMAQADKASQILSVYMRQERHPARALYGQMALDCVEAVGVRQEGRRGWMLRERQGMRRVLRVQDKGVRERERLRRERERQQREASMAPDGDVFFPASLLRSIHSRSPPIGGADGVEGVGEQYVVTPPALSGESVYREYSPSPFTARQSLVQTLHTVESPSTRTTRPLHPTTPDLTKTRRIPSLMQPPGEAESHLQPRLTGRPERARRVHTNVSKSVASLRKLNSRKLNSRNRRAQTDLIAFSSALGQGQRGSPTHREREREGRVSSPSSASGVSRPRPISAHHSTLTSTRPPVRLGDVETLREREREEAGTDRLRQAADRWADGRSLYSGVLSPTQERERERVDRGVKRRELISHWSPPQTGSDSYMPSATPPPQPVGEAKRGRERGGSRAGVCRGAERERERESVSRRGPSRGAFSTHSPGPRSSIYGMYK
ncbi:hypothetical protein KIPB_004240 [Kipferlia bialata]|uniref:Uncharacterized protein n=1 Tax=Kipferlia bialata TaxID=797122 RepID=A0A9K3CUS3_9EUKA|nr:hypothetical protein KIPB_004240 [Kipferlia bialata]|eukprot:g4240.t1